SVLCERGAKRLTDWTPAVSGVRSIPQTWLAVLGLGWGAIVLIFFAAQLLHPLDPFGDECYT
ncbi:hypothetical protein, partial [Leptolyngbya sp. FACHB-36]|uniref:hypothetical protein n=1 Tax=Leptolyngbya sp. FACHB-36 TaxID=2692808 RepID=UPI001A7EB92F